MVPLHAAIALRANRFRISGHLMPNVTTGGRNWIAEICRRFSDATGWSLTFEPADEADSSNLPAAAEECCWSTAINDGRDRLGILRLNPPERRQHPEWAFTAVSELVDLIADLATRSARSSRRLRSRTRHVTTLMDISRSVPSKADLLGGLRHLLQAACRLTGFRGTAFFLLEPNTQQLNLRSEFAIDALQVPMPRRGITDRPPDLEALRGHVASISRSGYADAELWLPDGTASGVCCPVRSAAGPLGTLWAYDRREREPGDRERHVLESIAAQIAGLLERAVLLKESAAEHRMRHHLQIASQSQHPVLPQTEPLDPKLDVIGLCTSRYELGGDLCEVFSLDKRRTVLAVGDASGDSVPAAMVMSAVRGAVRALAQSRLVETIQTQTVMQSVNRALSGMTPSHQFMSLLYGVFDSHARTFTYTNAGHPIPLHVSGTRVTQLISHGMLLGVLDEVEYERSTVSLKPGDLIVFFSDGVSEAMSRTRKMFRSDGVVEALKECVHDSSEAVLEKIWGRLESHLLGSGEPDDRTLLVARLKS